MTEGGWVSLNAGTYNTHLSRTLRGPRGGDLGWLLEEFPGVVIWTLQEIQSRRTLRRALRAAGVLRKWRILSPPRERPGHPHILVKRARFDVLLVEAPWLPSRFARARTTAVLFDKVARRYVGVANVHPDPLGKGFEKASNGARMMHERQVNAHVEWLMKWTSIDGKGTPANPAALEAVVIAAGDCNERLDEPIQRESTWLGKRTVTQRMARAGMRPTHLLTPRGDTHADLDDVWIRDDHFVKVVSRVVVDTPSRDADHRAVVARMRVLVGSPSAIHTNKEKAA